MGGAVEWGLDQRGRGVGERLGMGEQGTRLGAERSGARLGQGEQGSDWSQGSEGLIGKGRVGTGGHIGEGNE